MGRTWAVLTHRLRLLSISADYRRLWLAQAFSSFGEYLFTSTSVVWVATQLFPGSAHLSSLVGFIVLSASVPRIIVGPVAGVYADRWRPRRTMVVTDLSRAVLFVVLLGVEFGRFGHGRIFVAIVGCIVLSEICAQFFNPSRAAMLQVIVPSERRVEAVSMTMFSLTGVAIIATAAGPAIFGLFGARMAIIISIATYSLSCVMTLRVNSRHQPNRKVAGNFWRDFIDGAQVLWRMPMLRIVMIGVCLYSVSLGVNNSVLALFALKTLGLSVSEYGFLAMLFPAGNLIGAIFGVNFIKRVGIHRAHAAALTALGLGFSAYACVWRLLTAGALMLVCGALLSMVVLCQGPILQEVVPEGYMGRISAIAGPITAMTSAASTLVTSQALSLAADRGLTAGTGVWEDPYRLVIIFGAMFLLIGGIVMYVVNSCN